MKNITYLVAIGALLVSSNCFAAYPTEVAGFSLSKHYPMASFRQRCVEDGLFEGEHISAISGRTILECDVPDFGLGKVIYAYYENNEQVQLVVRLSQDNLGSAFQAMKVCRTYFTTNFVGTNAERIHGGTWQSGSIINWGDEDIAPIESVVAIKRFTYVDGSEHTVTMSINEMSVHNRNSWYSINTVFESIDIPYTQQ